MLHKYTLLKSSWGIVIFLDVEEIRNPKLQETDTLVSDKIYLRISDVDKLPGENAEGILSQGISSLSDLIVDQLDGEAVCYHVRSIDFNYTDFQLAGLYCAIREWISVYYGIPVEPVKVAYDAKLNRYVFDLPG